MLRSHSLAYERRHISSVSLLIICENFSAWISTDNLSTVQLGLGRMLTTHVHVRIADASCAGIKAPEPLFATENFLVAV
jgi:hypothetical protein